MNLHLLRQRRAELRSATQAIIAAPAGPDGLLSDEQRSDYDGKIGELDRIIGDEQRLERIAKEDAEATGKPLNGNPGSDGIEYRVFANVKSTSTTSPDAWRTPEGDRVPVLGVEQRIAEYLPEDESAASEIGLSGFLRALVNGPRTDTEKRALSEGAVASGGALLPTPLATEVIDAARTRNVAFQAGARTVPMTAKALRMASVISDPVPQWRAENANIAESEPVFGDLSL
jgi:HK97 family phage major capsid protein